MLPTRYSNVKKDDIIFYLNNKLNQNTQDVVFSTGVDGMPLYKPMTQETSEGRIEGLEFFDESTYQKTKKDVVAYSIPVIEADYANLKTIEQDKQIRTSSWSVALSFLVYTGSYVHNKLLFSIEEFRDKLLGGFDIMDVYQFDYANDSRGEAVKFNVVTTASDVVAGGLLTISGDKYIEYILRIDLDIGEDIAYGNQFEFYISGQGVAQTRVLPIQASFGASNTLEGFQLLRQPTLTGKLLERSQAVHNIIASRGWAINFTFLFERKNLIIKKLFQESFLFRSRMNDAKYKILVKVKYYDEISQQFVYDNDLEFERDIVVGETSTEVVYGDNILFGIGFALSWEDV
jgi:hypothetical protein